MVVTKVLGGYIHWSSIFGCDQSIWRRDELVSIPMARVPSVMRTFADCRFSGAWNGSLVAGVQD